MRGGIKWSGCAAPKVGVCTNPAGDEWVWLNGVDARDIRESSLFLGDQEWGGSVGPIQVIDVIVSSVAAARTNKLAMSLCILS